PVPEIRGFSQQRLQARDFQHRYARFRYVQIVGQRRLYHDGPRTGGDRLAHILPPITRQSWAGKEGITGHHAARVQTQAGPRLESPLQPVDDIFRLHRDVSPLGFTATNDSMGASGCTPRRRRLLPTTSANTGAATRPP